MRRLWHSFFGSSRKKKTRRLKGKVFSGGSNSCVKVSLLVIAWQHSASSHTHTHIPNSLPMLWFHMGNYYYLHHNMCNNNNNNNNRNQFILKIWIFFWIHHRNDNNKTDRFKCSKCFVIWIFIQNFVLLSSFGVEAIIWMETSFVMPMQIIFIVLCSILHPSIRWSVRKK